VPPAPSASVYVVHSLSAATMAATILPWSSFPAHTSSANVSGAHSQAPADDFVYEKSLALTHVLQNPETHCESGSLHALVISLLS